MGPGAASLDTSFTPLEVATMKRILLGGTVAVACAVSGCTPVGGRQPSGAPSPSAASVAGANATQVRPRTPPPVGAWEMVRVTWGKGKVSTLISRPALIGTDWAVVVYCAPAGRTPGEQVTYRLQVGGTALEAATMDCSVGPRVVVNGHAGGQPPAGRLDLSVDTRGSASTGYVVVTDLKTARALGK